MTETGHDSAGDGYLRTQTATSSQPLTVQSGNEITGDYTLSETEIDGSTARESDTYGAGYWATFTETTGDTVTTQETGNSVFGSFTLSSRSGTAWSTDVDHGVDSTGSFSVTENSSQTFNGGGNGNSITGSVTTSETATENYTLTETGSDAAGDNFTLTETGIETPTMTETANAFTGSYTTTTTGTDSYTLKESGTNVADGNPPGRFKETVIGSESDTLIEQGDANQTVSRTESGAGTFTRSGYGSTSGSTDWTINENSNFASGNLSQSETGNDRYSLLEQFNKVDNASNGSPGHMDFYAFGQAFVDPPVDQSPSNPAEGPDFANENVGNEAPAEGPARLQVGEFAKPEASADVVRQWAGQFPTREALTGKGNDFQVETCGPTETRVEGGGEQVWADGVNCEEGLLVEAKFASNPYKSPFVPSSAAGVQAKDGATESIDEEFAKYSAIIQDPNNPIRGLQVITNNQETALWLRDRMAACGVPGRVDIVQFGQYSTNGGPLL